MLCVDKYGVNADIISEFFGALTPECFTQDETDLICQDVARGTTFKNWK